MAGQELAARSEQERAKRSEFGGGAITGQSGDRRGPEQIYIGQANDEGGVAMPQDLQAGYLNLAIPGSPLGEAGVLAAHDLRNAQMTQAAIFGSLRKKGYRA
ncbi:MAG: hypothetical protein JRE18_01725 [Deltaproteobacteria bacterium]|jgi:hypothetical protein|nr:hypothetical protein [Deltaproteobacteria bacterium]